MKVVYLKWKDSAAQHGWVSKDNFEPQIVDIETVGFLVHEDEEKVTVSASNGDYEIDSPISIPRFAITEFQEIEFVN